MSKAVMMGITYHSADPTDENKVLVLVTFRFLGVGQDLGTLDAMIIVADTDTPATLTTKIQSAVVSRAAEYGVTLADADLVPLTYGVPQSLMSSSNSASMTLIDDGTNLDVYGSLGILRLSANSSTGARLLLDPSSQGVGIEYRPSGNLFIWREADTIGTGDLGFFAYPTNPTGYMIVESVNSAGMVIATNTNVPISIRPNEVEIAKFDTVGMTTAGGVQVKSVAKQTYTVTNLTTDRSYNANSTTVAELADVLGTLVDDLRTIGMVA